MAGVATRLLGAPPWSPRQAGAPPRRHFVHEDAPLCAVDEGTLRGLRHRTVIDARDGALQLALWEERHEVGFDVPDHAHDCEEIITLLAGGILARIDGEAIPVAAGESILIPEGALHGFSVVAGPQMRLLAIFGSPRPRIFRADGSESAPPWEGGRPDHLDDAPPRGQA